MTLPASKKPQLQRHRCRWWFCLNMELFSVTNALLLLMATTTMMLDITHVVKAQGEWLQHVVFLPSQHTYIYM